MSGSLCWQRTSWERFGSCLELNVPKNVLCQHKLHEMYLYSTVFCQVSRMSCNIADPTSRRTGTFPHNNVRVVLMLKQLEAFCSEDLPQSRASNPAQLKSQRVFMDFTVPYSKKQILNNRKCRSFLYENLYNVKYWSPQHNIYIVEGKERREKRDYILDDVIN